jgi:hypothetical protein
MQTTAASRASTPRPTCSSRVRVENQRRHDGDEEAPERAAGGNQQVKRREMAGMRFQPVELPVAEHAADEQSGAIAADLFDQGSLKARNQQVADHCAADHQQRAEQPASVPTRAVEADDEGEQVKAEWQHPQERNDRHVLAELVRRGQQQDRRGGRQDEPQRLVPARWRRRDLSFRGGGGSDWHNRSVVPA